MLRWNATKEIEDAKKKMQEKNQKGCRLLEGRLRSQMSMEGELWKLRKLEAHLRAVSPAGVARCRFHDALSQPYRS